MLNSLRLYRVYVSAYLDDQTFAFTNLLLRLPISDISVVALHFGKDLTSLVLTVLFLDFCSTTGETADLFFAGVLAVEIVLEQLREALLFKIKDHFTGEEFIPLRAGCTNLT